MIYPRLQFIAVVACLIAGFHNLTGGLAMCAASLAIFAALTLRQTTHTPKICANSQSTPTRF
jgi:hypothetical protein